MTDERDRRLLRFLAGELSPAERAALQRELAGDPRLAARHAELRAVWEGLELPPPSPPPPGFASRVVARSREAARREVWLPTAGARLAAAAALAAGLALGVGLGWAGAPAVEPVTASYWAPEPTLAESYWGLDPAELPPVDEEVVR